MSKPTHDVCIAEDYTAADGEEKAYFTNVGSAWLKDSGTMSVELRAGLALSGRFVIMPKRERDNA